MNFIQSNHHDIDTILSLYDLAAVYQIEKGMLNWQGFERSLVGKTMDEGFQWQIIIDGKIACVFTLALSDPLIWGERDADPAVYIHRIATNPEFRGNHFVKDIITWLTKYTVSRDKKYIRLDTLSGNEQLHNYYISCGFTYLGHVKLKEAEGLPAHYQNGMFSLFEIKLS